MRVIINYVFLETYYYDDTENSINTITFSIEVILIKNIKIDYIETPEDESNEYFWTISCTFDSKVKYNLI